MAKRTGRKRQKNGRRHPPPPPSSFLEQNWRMMAIVIVVFLIVAVSAYALNTVSPDDGTNGNGNGNGPPTVDKAPEFQVVTIDGESIALDQFRGQVVILDLMATWCGPCVTQMEYLNQVRAAYTESEVVLLSIGVDTKETGQQLRTFRDENHANWRFARDTDGVGQKYGATNIPTLVIVDKDGMMVWKDAGVTPFEDLEKRIDPLL